MSEGESVELFRSRHVRFHHSVPMDRFLGLLSVHHGAVPPRC